MTKTNLQLPEAFRDAYDYWRELTLPEHFEFAKLEGENPDIVFDKEILRPCIATP